MVKKGNDKGRLRKRAERLAADRKTDVSGLTAEDTARLVHELEVGQIELELQNVELQEAQHDIELHSEELVRAKEELERSNARYADLYDNAPAGYFTVDTSSSRIVEVNLTAAKMLGLEKDKILGAPFSRFVRSEFSDRVYISWRKALQQETAKTVEVQMRRQAGGSFWASLEIVPEPRTGRVRISALNVNARRWAQEAYEKSNRRMSQILESITDGFFAVDDDWRFTYVNARAASNLGLTVADLLGNNLWDRLPRLLGTEHEAYYRRAMKDRAQQTFEAGGALAGRWYEISVYPWAEGISVFWHDVTDKRNAEQIKDEFIGMVSHELKTPLTVVMGAIETALTGTSGEEDTRSLLQDAAWGARTMADIVENLLELSRFQANRLVIEPSPLNVARVVRRIVQESRKKSEIHSVVAEIEKDVPEVRADVVRLERVLYNLIDNAIKYSPDGGEIKVAVRQEDGYILFSVQDHGRGIAREDQPKLFEPFQRLDTVPGSSVQGVGLGLVVCRRLVEAHGGRIWLESKPGVGSTFYFTLPVADKALGPRRESATHG